MSFNKFFIIFLALITVRTTAQSTASQQVSRFDIFASQLDTTKTIWVYLPKNYKNSKKHYPVIYMLDAQNLFDKATSYAGEWEIDEYLDTKAKKEAIIIGIEHGEKKRFNELTPYSNPEYGGGGGNQFLDFIITTLKPHVDKAYRTKNDAKNTSIIGASLGGLMAFYAVVKHPEVFQNAGAFSPSFWFSEKIFDLVKATTIKKQLKFSFVVGDQEGKDMVDGQLRMITLLKDKGVKKRQIKASFIEGGQHNEKLWRKHFPIAFNWFVKR
ncbi:MAG: alpha/beta hydrolase-fold protein [Bacteroidota bacterium]